MDDNHSLYRAYIEVSMRGLGAVMGWLIGFGWMVWVKGVFEVGLISWRSV